MVTGHLQVPSSNRESGQILILTSVSLVALMGIAALSLDASYMFAKRNRLHAAADAAAKSGSYEIIRNPFVTATGLEAFADQQVAAHGFTPTRLGGTTSVVVLRPPANTSPFAGNHSYIEVRVSEPTPTFFGRILGWVSMNPRATAIAGPGNPSACIIVEEDLTFGNSVFTLNGCGIAVGEDLYGENPGSEVNGTPLPSVTVGDTCTGYCSLMGSLYLGVPPPPDPLAGLPIPTNPGGCIAGVAATLNPGCYTSIAATVTTLNPGIYYVTGAVDVANLTGNGVMIYLAAPSGQLIGENNGALHLRAPTSGPWVGVAVFQGPTNTTDLDIKNQFTMDVFGAVYTPGLDISWKNTIYFVDNSCSIWIAKSLDIKNGNGTLSNSGCGGAFGGARFLAASIAR